MTSRYGKTKWMIDKLIEQLIEQSSKTERKRCSNIVSSYIQYASNSIEEDINDMLHEILKKIQGKESK